MDYLPGDTLAILSRTPKIWLEIIRNCCPIFREKFDSAVQLRTSINGRHKPLPPNLPAQPTTLCNIFETAIELNFVPKKAFLSALVEHNCLTDPKERRLLAILASREGSVFYSQEISGRSFRFLKLLEILKSWNFTEQNIGVLLDNCKPLSTRPYSVTTNLLSTEAHPAYERLSTIVKFLYSIHDPPGKATTHLIELTEGVSWANPNPIPRIGLFFRKPNKFRLTTNDLNKPIIMVAAGTAIAPFIGFLEYIREQSRRSYPASRNTDRYTWLIYGTRYENTQLYREKLQGFVADGTLTIYDECFSQDNEQTHTPYVHHLIRSKGNEMVQRLVNNPTGVSSSRMFVCGKPAVLKNVRDVMIESIKKTPYGETDKAAKDFFETLETNSNYVEDTWLHQ